MEAEHQAGRYLGHPTTTGIRAARVFALYSVYFCAVLSQGGPTHVQRHLGFECVPDMYARHGEHRPVRSAACAVRGEPIRCMHTVEHWWPADTTSSSSADVEYYWPSFIKLG